MRNGEAALQAQIVAAIREAVPEAIVFAVLYDGLYSKSEAAKRKWMGLAAGLPDVGIAFRGRAYFLEVKLPGRTTSDDQDAMLVRLDRTGVPAAVVRSVDETLVVLQQWGVLSKRAA